MRKLYAESKERNAIHASDSDENAEREAPLLLRGERYHRRTIGFRRGADVPPRGNRLTSRVAQTCEAPARQVVLMAMLSFDIRDLESARRYRRRGAAPRRCRLAGGRPGAMRAPSASPGASRRPARGGSTGSGRIAGAARAAVSALSDRNVGRRSSDEAHLLFAEAGDEERRVTIRTSTGSIVAARRTRSASGGARTVAARRAGVRRSAGRTARGSVRRCGADLNAGPCSCAPMPTRGGTPCTSSIILHDVNSVLTL